MSAFSDRLSEFSKDMGLFQYQLGEVIGINPKTLSSYISSGRTPTFDGLVDISRKTGLSLDWLTGLGRSNKWNEEIHDLRSWLLVKAPSIRADSELDRCIIVMKLARERSQVVGQEWFSTGILALPQFESVLDKWLAGEVPLSRRALFGISQLTNLPESWLLLGGEEYLSAHMVDNDISASVQRFVIRMKESGITPEELDDNFIRIETLIKQIRKLTK